MAIDKCAQRSSSVDRQQALIGMNTMWLEQALELLSQLDDTTYTAVPRELAPHRAGSHLRHIVEFYECFLDGVESAHVDYDARRRDPFVEQSRAAAELKIRRIMERLKSEPEIMRDCVIWVRMEDAGATGLTDPFMLSSVSRELQVLSSHTIHHFALISATLRALGVYVDSDFGMAPSTLRYLKGRAA
ncbi:MAG: hypothetical protein ABI693_06850 [Bryobacteraceae bacterium]